MGVYGVTWGYQMGFILDLRFISDHELVHDKLLENLIFLLKIGTGFVLVIPLTVFYTFFLHICNNLTNSRDIHD